MLKTFAVEAKDLTGTVYTVGHFLAETWEEAKERVKNQFDENHWPEEVTADTEMIRCVEDLIRETNRLEWERIKLRSKSHAQL